MYKLAKIYLNSVSDLVLCRMLGYPDRYLYSIFKYGMAYKVEKSGRGFSFYLFQFFFVFAGATREIGACLTRIVLRHKAMESRMKTLCSALLECMILPLQDKVEEWRKNVGVLDKDHAKEYKKVH
jgi:hypothetical protein